MPRFPGQVDSGHGRIGDLTSPVRRAADVLELDGCTAQDNAPSSAAKALRINLRSPRFRTRVTASPGRNQCLDRQRDSGQSLTTVVTSMRNNTTSNRVPAFS